MSPGRGFEEDVRPLERALALASLFAETAETHDRDRTFPFENFDRLAEAGLLALRTPLSFGGHGTGILDAARVIGVIAEGEPATALVLAMQYIQHAGMARSTRWPLPISERLARETVAGVSLINALRVEPELGSPARGGLPATTATRTDDRWSLSGHKIYATGVPILSWYAVWAKTDEASPRVGVFLVQAGLPGIRVVETWDHLGLRASGSHDVFLDKVSIPLDHAVDIRPASEWTLQDTLQQHIENAILLAALYNGIAKSARDWLVTFLQARVPANLGQPLASLPRVQDVVGSIEMLLRTNDRLIEGLAADIDADLPFRPTDAHVVKSVVTNNAVQAVELALSLAGNHGLSRANPLERHYRDVLCGRVHTPQDDSVRHTLGRDALG
jgi:alkylation response protein AidB-like acyl-CoA dehydrogenase